MTSELHRELADLRVNLLKMASMVEEAVLRAVDSITLMLDKPFTEYTEEYDNLLMDQIQRCNKYTGVSMDSCLSQLNAGICGQGRISMAIDQTGKFSAFSNCSKKFEASSLKAAWDMIRLKDDKLAIGYIL